MPRHHDWPQSCEQISGNFAAGTSPGHTIRDTNPLTAPTTYPNHEGRDEDVQPNTGKYGQEQMVRNLVERSLDSALENLREDDERGLHRRWLIHHNAAVKSASRFY